MASFAKRYLQLFEKMGDDAAYEYFQTVSHIMIFLLVINIQTFIFILFQNVSLTVEASVIHSIDHSARQRQNKVFPKKTAKACARVKEIILERHNPIQATASNPQNEEGI